MGGPSSAVGRRLAGALRTLRRERDELRWQLARLQTRQPRRLRLLLIGGTLASAAGTTYWFYRAELDFLGRALMRSGRTLLAALQVSLDYRSSLHRWWHLPSDSNHACDPTYLEARRACNIRAARTLLRLFQRNAGIYIKLGQHLSALEYILPPEFCAVMAVLHNEAPKSPIEDVERILREDLGHGIDELFVSFNAEPIGTASLAQVHHAVLKDTGEPVAVKVQHLSIQSYAEVDIFTVSLAVQAVKYMFPEFEFDWLADEMRINLPKELDFVQEALNSERVMWNFRQNASRSRHLLASLKIPRIMWQYTTPRVLTMEFCPGAKVTDLDYLHAHHIDPYHVSERLVQVFSEMVFIHGFVHCDPHPGNVFVRVVEGEHSSRRWRWLFPRQPRWELVLLDHGLYREISRSFRLSYARLWKAMVEADVEGIKRFCQELGAGDAYRLFSSMLTHRTWSSVSGSEISTQTTLQEAKLIKDRVPGYLTQVAELLAKLPRPLLLLLKSNDLLRSIERVLHEPSDKRPIQSFFITARCCADAIHLDGLASQLSLARRLSLHLDYWSTLFRIGAFELLVRCKLFLFGRSLF